MPKCLLNTIRRQNINSNENCDEAPVDMKNSDGLNSGDTRAVRSRQRKAIKRKPSVNNLSVVTRFYMHTDRTSEDDGAECQRHGSQSALEMNWSNTDDTTLPTYFASSWTYRTSDWEDTDWARAPSHNAANLLSVAVAAPARHSSAHSIPRTRNYQRSGEHKQRSPGNDGGICCGEAATADSLSSLPSSSSSSRTSKRKTQQGEYCRSKRAAGLVDAATALALSRYYQSKATTSGFHEEATRTPHIESSSSFEAELGKHVNYDSTLHTAPAAAVNLARDTPRIFNTNPGWEACHGFSASPAIAQSHAACNETITSGRGLGPDYTAEPTGLSKPASSSETPHRPESGVSALLPAPPRESSNANQWVSSFSERASRELQRTQLGVTPYVFTSDVSGGFLMGNGLLPFTFVQPLWLQTTPALSSNSAEPPSTLHEGKLWQPRSLDDDGLSTTSSHVRQKKLKMEDTNIFPDGQPFCVDESCNPPTTTPTSPCLDIQMEGAPFKHSAVCNRGELSHPNEISQADKISTEERAYNEMCPSFSSVTDGEFLQNPSNSVAKPVESEHISKADVKYPQINNNVENSKLPLSTNNSECPSSLHEEEIPCIAMTAGSSCCSQTATKSPELLAQPLEFLEAETSPTVIAVHCHSKPKSPALLQSVTASETETPREVTIKHGCSKLGPPSVTFPSKTNLDPGIQTRTAATNYRTEENNTLPMLPYEVKSSPLLPESITVSISMTEGSSADLYVSKSYSAGAGCSDLAKQDARTGQVKNEMAILNSESALDKDGARISNCCTVEGNIAKEIPKQAGVCMDMALLQTDASGTDTLQSMSPAADRDVDGCTIRHGVKLARQIGKLTVDTHEDDNNVQQKGFVSPATESRLQNISAGCNSAGKVIMIRARRQEDSNMLYHEDFFTEKSDCSSRDNMTNIKLSDCDNKSTDSLDRDAKYENDGGSASASTNLSCKSNSACYNGGNQDRYRSMERTGRSDTMSAAQLCSDFIGEDKTHSLRLNNTIPTEPLHIKADEARVEVKDLRQSGNNTDATDCPGNNRMDKNINFNTSKDFTQQKSSINEQVESQPCSEPNMEKHSSGGLLQQKVNEPAAHSDSRSQTNQHPHETQHSFVNKQQEKQLPKICDNDTGTDQRDEHRTQAFLQRDSTWPLSDNDSDEITLLKYEDENTSLQGDVRGAKEEGSQLVNRGRTARNYDNSHGHRHDGCQRDCTLPVDHNESESSHHQKPSNTSGRRNGLWQHEEQQQQHDCKTVRKDDYSKDDKLEHQKNKNNPVQHDTAAGAKTSRSSSSSSGYSSKWISAVAACISAHHDSLQQSPFCMFPHHLASVLTPPIPLYDNADTIPTTSSSTIILNPLLMMAHDPSVNQDTARSPLSNITNSAGTGVIGSIPGRAGTSKTNTANNRKCSGGRKKDKQSSVVEPAMYEPSSELLSTSSTSLGLYPGTSVAAVSSSTDNKVSFCRDTRQDAFLFYTAAAAAATTSGSLAGIPPSALGLGLGLGTGGTGGGMENLVSPHGCQQCSLDFQSPADLRFHLTPHCPERTNCSSNNAGVGGLGGSNGGNSIDSNSRDRGGENNGETGDGEGAAAGGDGGSSENRNKCAVCSRVFTRSWLLKGHMRTHTGERPFRCTWPQCQRAFADKSNLRSHTLIHTTTAKSFSCPKCSRAFSQKRYLHKHMLEVCRII